MASIKFLLDGTSRVTPISDGEFCASRCVKKIVICILTFVGNGVRDGICVAVAVNVAVLV